MKGGGFVAFGDFNNDGHVDGRDSGGSGGGSGCGCLTMIVVILIVYGILKLFGG